QAGSTFYASSGTVNTLAVNGALTLGNGVGSANQVLQTGIGGAPTWVSVPGASTLLSTTNTWTATQMYVSSIAVSAPGGIGVTYGAVLGSATINNLTNNQYVKTNGSNQLVSSSIQSTDIPGGATSYIQLTGALQAGSTFYVSSGTVNTLTLNG